MPINDALVPNGPLFLQLREYIITRAEQSTKTKTFGHWRQAHFLYFAFHRFLCVFNIRDWLLFCSTVCRPKLFLSHAGCTRNDSSWVDAYFWGCARPKRLTVLISSGTFNFFFCKRTWLIHRGWQRRCTSQSTICTGMLKIAAIHLEAQKGPCYIHRQNTFVVIST